MGRAIAHPGPPLNGLIPPDGDRYLLLWNPSTRKYLEIKIDLGFVKKDVSVGVYGSLYTSGFGYDASSNDYKVFTSADSVRGISDRTRLDGVYLYSLKAKTWRRVNASFVVDGQYYISYGVHLNGVIYFLIKMELGGGDFCYVILSFALLDDSFREIPSPDVDVNPDASARLTTFPSIGKHLAYVLTTDSTVEVKVRGLDGVSESWQVVFSVNLHSDIGNLCLLNFRKNGDVLVRLQDERVASLNPMNMRLTMLGDARHLSYQGTYVENLLFL